MKLAIPFLPGIVHGSLLPLVVILTAEPLLARPVPDEAVRAAEEARIATIARASAAAVAVFDTAGQGGGSGVVISPDGYALTNFHVVAACGPGMKCGLPDGRIYDAVIVGIDPTGDVALIQLLGRDDFPHAPWGDSDAARVGDWAFTVGNPFLLAYDFQPSVAWGMISGTHRYQYPAGTLLEYADCIQTDASINPGNSGGPLFDATGNLIGINGRGSFEKRGRVNVGAAYAISINQIRNFLGYLHSGRIVDHATLGATVATDPEGGVSVTNILESSDAYRRGLRYSAEVLEIDGRVVQTANDVQNVLATLPSGWRVKLTYRLEGETKDTLVRLMSVHQEDELLEKMAGALPPPPPRKQDKKKDDEGEEEKDAAPTVDSKYPKTVRQLVERKGYANYHFNLVQQDRFITAIRDQFPGGKQDEDIAWVIEGETDEAEPRKALLRVTSGNMAMLIGDQSIEADTKADLYDEVSGRSIAGILPALDAWRRMIAEGPKKFGETYYLGSMPLGGERPLRDCIVGIDAEFEVRWLYHPHSELVEAIEVFADRDQDPAELWLIRENASDPKPTFLELRYGLEKVLRLRVKSWQRVPESELKQATKEKA